MRSIKRGRGPSMMGGIYGIFMICIGIVWTVITASEAGGVFALFGVFWTAIAIVQTIYNFKNATNKNRYSEYDITDKSQEPDPLNKKFGKDDTGDINTYGQQNINNVMPPSKSSSRYCPFCGKEVSEGFSYCNNCGKKLP